MLKHYRNQSCPVPGALMEDSVTYAVLVGILQGQCAHIFTDHENVVVCHSCPPFPVWVWCRDVQREENVDQIARCMKEELPMEQGYVHILSHELLETLREKDAYFRGAKEKMGLLSYWLDEINSIDYPCDGSMSLVREEEIPSLVGVRHDMSMEMEGMDLSPERCEESLRKYVEKKALYAWRRDDGEIVALTARGDQGEFSKISMVYTLPRHRRKGYAINLVHGVTRTILADGLVPILYTDAGYGASNACYQKIGYKLVGKLTSICR